MSNSGYFSRSDQRSYVFEVDGESAVISYTKTLDGSRYCAFSDEIPSSVNSTHDDRFLIALEKGDINYIATNENHRKYLIIALVTTEDTSTLQVEKGISYTTYEPYTETTASIPITAPLYDGDYMEVYADGSGKIVRTNAKIDSYAGEEITTDYVSTTGELSEGATVVYKLATPTEEPLTPEQVEQFKQLYTFDNVTNVFCDGETTVRYYVNNDCGDTVGMLQEEVDGIKNDLSKFDGIDSMQISNGELIITVNGAKYTFTPSGVVI